LLVADLSAPETAGAGDYRRPIAWEAQDTGDHGVTGFAERQCVCSLRYMDENLAVSPFMSVNSGLCLVDLPSEMSSFRRVASLSDIGLHNSVIARWRNPALALICFLLAICCFVVASKLGCGCVVGQFDAAHVKAGS
jgi:hypothetical protein